MDARARSPDVWATFDAATASGFERLFQSLRIQGRRVLEIGSGHGFLCLLAALHGAREVHGIELVRDAVEFAERLHADVDPSLPVVFHRASAAERLPFADASFDRVLLIEVLSHIAREPESVLDEVVRVTAPGGVVFVSDGNNARSAKRRRDNQEIWRRFECGPPTAPGETVHTHVIARTYRDIRRDIALDEDPALGLDQAATLAERTSGLNEAGVRRAVRVFRESGALPDSLYDGRCPVEPRTGMYIEQLLDPVALSEHLRRAGCRVRGGIRRALAAPLIQHVLRRGLWRYSNGFTLFARKDDGSCRRVLPAGTLPVEPPGRTSR